MRRFRFFIIVLFFLLQGLFAQEKQYSFPVALLLEATDHAKTECWQPDWPMEIPPDAFKTVSQDWVCISLSLGEKQYTLRQNNDGLVLEFPWFYNGLLSPVKIEYGSDAGTGTPLIWKIDLPEFANMEVLEFSNLLPSLLRINQNEVYSFVQMNWGAGSVSESWFDQEGSFLELYEYKILSANGRERIRSFSNFPNQEELLRYFDSRFLVTGISGPGGNYFLYYQDEDIPAYREQYTRDDDKNMYSLQWDERGLLVRLLQSKAESADPESEDSDSEVSPGFLDSRYEYILDERGNWIQRQEIIMTNAGDYLVPSMGPQISRVLEYRDTHE